MKFSAATDDLSDINLNATLQTHLFEDRVMKLDNLTVGKGCSLGETSVVLYGSTMEDGSLLGSLSLLMKGESLPGHTAWHGIPAQRATQRASVPVSTLSAVVTVATPRTPALSEGLAAVEGMFYNGAGMRE